MTDLSRKRERERLTPRHEPYWQRLAEGAYLGFRRGPDTWLARVRGRDQMQKYHALGQALEYDEAKRRAEAWLSQFVTSPFRAARRDTIMAALETYLTDLRRHSRSDAAKAAEGRFKTALAFDQKANRYRDPLAELPLDKVTQEDFLDWRDRLGTGRLPRTVNRLVRAVTAGLTRAHQLGHLGNPQAWRLQSLPDDDESETAVFLTPAQRKSLIRAASPEAAALLRGLELTGGRPKELADALIADFDGTRLKLAHRKGRPPRLRSRYVVLDHDGVSFFKELVSNKSPSDRLFTAANGKKWRRDMWAAHVRSAVDVHNSAARPESRISTNASAYSFRHARISELLQVYGIDPLTVAAQTGTSLRMIERAYFKFIRSAMLEKLAGLEPRSGGTQSSGAATN